MESLLLFCGLILIIAVIVKLLPNKGRIPETGYELTLEDKISFLRKANHPVVLHLNYVCVVGTVVDIKEGGIICLSNASQDNEDGSCVIGDVEVPIDQVHNVSMVRRAA